MNKVIPFILLIFKNYNGYKMPLRITAFLWIRIRRNLTDPPGALQILVYTQILLNWTIFLYSYILHILLGGGTANFSPSFFWGGGGGWSRLLFKLTFKLCRAVDPHSFFYESGSSYFLNANSDPAFTKYIKNTLM